jgi:large subunit ribosomal protein L18
MGKATGPVYKVAFRRRRSQLTNYAKRLALVKSASPRMVVRKSNKGIKVQFVSFTPKGDSVLASAHSSLLSKYKWMPKRNSPTAYLTGLLCARLAMKKGVKDFVLDIGLQTPSKGSVVFAALKGALDAGLKSPHDAGMIDARRISGEHISAFAKSAKAAGTYDKLFAEYKKAGIDAEKISELFTSVKQQISSS